MPAEFSERTPLLSVKESRSSSADDAPLLAQFFERRIIDNVPVTSNQCQKIVRITLVTVSSILAVLGRVGFIPYSLDSPQVMGLGNSTFGVFIGWVCAYGYTTSFSFIMIWAFLNIIYAFLAPMSPEERELLVNTDTESPWNWRNVVALVLGLAIGCLCVVPIAFLGYEAWIPTVGETGALWVGVGMFFASFSLPTYSSAISLQRIIRKRRTIKPTEVTAAAVRNQYVQELKTCARGLTALSDEERMKLITELRHISKFDSRYHRTELYLSTVFRSCLTRSRRVSQARNTLSTIFYCIGIPISTTRLGLLSYVSYEDSRKMVDNPGFNIFLAILVAFSLAWVYFTSVPITLVRLLNACIDYATRQFDKTLAQQFYPKLYAGLSVLILFTAAFTFGTPTKIAYDYFNWIYPLQVYLQVGISVFDFLLASCAMFDIMAGVINRYAVSYGRFDVRDTVRLQNNLLKFADIVKKCSLREFQEFLLEIPAFSLCSAENYYKTGSLYKG